MPTRTPWQHGTAHTRSAGDNLPFHLITGFTSSTNKLREFSPKLRAGTVKQANLDDEHTANISYVELLRGHVHRQLGDPWLHADVRSKTWDGDLTDHFTSTMILWIIQWNIGRLIKHLPIMHTNTTPWHFLEVRMIGSSLYGSITANPSKLPQLICKAGPELHKYCLISVMVNRPSSVTERVGGDFYKEGRNYRLLTYRHLVNTKGCYTKDVSFEDLELPWTNLIYWYFKIENIMTYFQSYHCQQVANDFPWSIWSFLQIWSVWICII